MKCIKPKSWLQYVVPIITIKWLLKDSSVYDLLWFNFNGQLSFESAVGESVPQDFYYYYGLRLP